MVFTNGKMEENTLVDINQIKNVGMENIIGMMGEYFRECGKMEKEMEKVELYIQMGLLKVELGKTIKKLMGMIEMI